jgi:DNA-directed RNA polymerase III subunit RPC7
MWASVCNVHHKTTHTSKLTFSAVKELLPEELWSVVDDGEEAAEGTVAPKKNLAFLKKRRLDKLARFDDGAEVDLTADADDDDDKNGDDEGADAPEELEDDDFTEDDDDLGDDYNAEKYFSGGENNEDDGGGDDGGGEDPW